MRKSQDGLDLMEKRGNMSWIEKGITCSISVSLDQYFPSKQATCSSDAIHISQLTIKSSSFPVLVDLFVNPFRLSRIIATFTSSDINAFLGRGKLLWVNSSYVSYNCLLGRGISDDDVKDGVDIEVYTWRPDLFFCAVL